MDDSEDLDADFAALLSAHESAPAALAALTASTPDAPDALLAALGEQVTPLAAAQQDL